MNSFTPQYVWARLESCNNISEDLLLFLEDLTLNSIDQDEYSKPVPWIGLYIAFASLICILAMVADLIHGFRNKRFWFPCQYFTLNAASLTLIAVAMKLPMDLSNPMPFLMDKAAKAGSMAFMCTMMANLLPSLATMNSKELLTNIIALGVLVITLVVNVCIQIKTGMFNFTSHTIAHDDTMIVIGAFILGPDYFNRFIEVILVAMLLMLLIIHTCSALMILKSKHLLESKYQESHKIASKDQELQQPGRLNVDKLKQYVSNYWIMAGTGSPQFVIVCSATTSASSVICALSTIIHTSLTIWQIYRMSFVYSRSNATWLEDYGSDYKWSIPVILITQSIGAILGTIAPVCRCFAALSFNLSTKWIWNHVSIFKVESYWTQKLCYWKQSSIPFLIYNHKIKVLVENIKILLLSIYIGFQKTVVITCKMIALIPIFFVICFLYCKRCWKWMKAMFISHVIVLEKFPEELERNQNLRKYVLQLQADTEVAERTLKSMEKSINRLIQKAENQQPNKLIKLLEESSSRNFAGVGKLDNHLIPPLPNCWSLLLVTLTTITISLPNILTNRVDVLLSSVSEGLAYVRLVEEILNGTGEHLNFQKAAKLLLRDVEVGHKWLGNKLKSINPQTTTTRQTLEWFRDKSENIFTAVERMDIEGSDEELVFRSVSAKSMYCVTQSILLSNEDDLEQVTQEELSSIIADIFAACLTNLPQVITMKCHTNEIEKREASVFEAAQLLGKTTQLIRSLQDREIPNLHPDELPFFDKWHAYLHSIP